MCTVHILKQVFKLSHFQGSSKFILLQEEKKIKPKPKHFDGRQYKVTVDLE